MAKENLFQELLHAFDIENGFFYNVKELTVSPHAISTYLSGENKKFLNPFKYIIIIIGIAVALQFFVQNTSVNFKNQFNRITEFDNNSLQENLRNQENSSTIEYVNWIMENRVIIFQAVILTILPIMALALKWTFRKPKYDFICNLRIVTLIYAQSQLLRLLSVPFIYIDFKISFILGGVIVAIYFLYSVYRIYNYRLLTTFARALFANIIIYPLVFVLMFLEFFIVGYLFFHVNPFSS